MVGEEDGREAPLAARGGGRAGHELDPAVHDLTPVRHDPAGVILARELVDQRLRVAPPGLRDVPEPRESLLELLERVDRLVAVRPKLGNGRESEPGVHQNQTVDPLGMHGCEELRHQAALRKAQETGALDALGLHDGRDVADPLLQGRGLREASCRCHLSKSRTFTYRPTCSRARR